MSLVGIRSRGLRSRLSLSQDGLWFFHIVAYPYLVTFVSLSGCYKCIVVGGRGGDGGTLKWLTSLPGIHINMVAACPGPVPRPPSDKRASGVEFRGRPSTKLFHPKSRHCFLFLAP